eukprot:gb/GEZN01020885.1/.p1 GENE.gb/GEZN01020885.1/~~gb/GEZN01020885.1/.p1  ORF type:complete len:164 (-),score=0.58 gb/GEZN01020885.1/:36-527(-)
MESDNTSKLVTPTRKREPMSASDSMCPMLEGSLSHMFSLSLVRFLFFLLSHISTIMYLSRAHPLFIHNKIVDGFKLVHMFIFASEDSHALTIRVNNGLLSSTRAVPARLPTPTLHMIAGFVLIKEDLSGEDTSFSIPLDSAGWARIKAFSRDRRVGAPGLRSC